MARRPLQAFSAPGLLLFLLLSASATPVNGGGGKPQQQPQKSGGGAQPKQQPAQPQQQSQQAAVPSTGPDPWAQPANTVPLAQAQAAGAQAWSASHQQPPGGPDPFKKPANAVPLAQAQSAGSQAWAASQPQGPPHQPLQSQQPQDAAGGAAALWESGKTPPSLAQAEGKGAAEYALQTGQVGTQGTLQLYSLSAYPDAVCNDGTPGGYYYAPSSSGSKQWLIYLMGGMWCYDQASCQLRMQDAVFQTSSNHWANTMTIGEGATSIGGVFSFNQANPFADANKVYLEYCSSDAWMGDMDASAATWGMAFKGQAIVSATLQDLVANRGLDESAEVIFGGCSAGGRGAMVLLDYVAPQLPTNAVRGLLDSGLWIDIPPMDSEEVSLQSQAQQGYALWNPSAVIPDACAKQYSGSDAWKCIYGVYRLPFVTTPYFVNEAQFDDFQMLYDTGGNVPETAGQVAYADTFQAVMLAPLNAAAAAKQAVFSTTCLIHCLTTDTQLLSYSANGVTIATALAQWLGGKTPVQISGCTGYACVQQCPGGQQIMGIQTAIDNSTPQAQAQAEAGTELNGVWVAQQMGMGMGGMSGGPGGMPGGQGYARSTGQNEDGAAQGAASQKGVISAAAANWMLTG